MNDERIAVSLTKLQDWQREIVRATDAMQRLARIMNIPPRLLGEPTSWVKRRKGKRLHKTHWRRKR